MHKFKSGNSKFGNTNIFDFMCKQDKFLHVNLNIFKQKLLDAQINIVNRRNTRILTVVELTFRASTSSMRLTSMM